MWTYLGYGCWSSRVLWLFEILVRIHKPILALVLQKFGAEAKIDHEDCRWGDILRFCDEDFWECDIMVVYAHGSIRWDCIVYSYLPKIHVEIYVMLLHFWERLQMATVFSNQIDRCLFCRYLLVVTNDSQRVKKHSARYLNMWILSPHNHCLTL